MKTQQIVEFMTILGRVERHSNILHQKTRRNASLKDRRERRTSSESRLLSDFCAILVVSTQNALKCVLLVPDLRFHGEDGPAQPGLNPGSNNPGSG